MPRRDFAIRGPFAVAQIVECKDLEAKIGARLTDALDTEKHPKAASYELVRAIKKELVAALPADDEKAKPKLEKYYEALRENIFRDGV